MSHTHDIDRRIKGADSRVLRRARLTQHFDDTNSSVQLWTLSAPAGFGKSTLINDVLAQHDGPVAAIAVSTATLRAGTLTQRIHEAIEAAIEAASGLTTSTRTLVAIDDTHLLVGTEALADLEAFMATSAPTMGAPTMSAPTMGAPTMKVILSGRGEIPIDLTPFRLHGTVCELGADDFRFRSWEVEELFHRVFRVSAPPSELAAIASATNGWAVALQLYRHATQRSTDAARRQQLALLRQSRLESVRSYLAANVLSGLSDNLREFAIAVSPLGRMTPNLCNRFLSRIDAQSRLDELVEHQLFTARVDDGSYRFHEVFRSFLETEFERTTTCEDRAERYLLAANLLAECGANGDALRAYIIAGHVEQAATLLDSLGALHSDSDHGGFQLPDGLLSDHRLKLARAARSVRDGHFTRALDEFRNVANDPLAFDIRAEAERQYQRLARWTTPEVQPAAPMDLLGQIRNRFAERKPDSDAEPIVHALDALLAGDLEAAIRWSDSIGISNLDSVESASETKGIEILAQVVRILAWWLLDGLDPSDDLQSLCDQADKRDDRWTTRMLLALTLAFPQPHDPPVATTLHRIERDASRAGDQWSIAIAQLFVLVGAAAQTLREQDLAAVARCAESASALHIRIGASALVNWTLIAKHLRQLPLTREEQEWLEASRSSLAARICEIEPPETLSEAEPHPLSWVLQTTKLQSHSEGIVRTSNSWTGESVVVGSVTGLHQCAVHLRLFGAFEILCNGVPVNVDRLRPRARAILHLLALHAGQAVHRDTILDAMWPDDDPAVSSKRLHVAISTIRHELGAVGNFVTRKGESYQFGGNGLAVVSDLAIFDEATQRFDQASGRLRKCADESTKQEVLAVALEVAALYPGPLLPEEGSCSWVVDQRDTRQRAVIRALIFMSKTALGSGNCIDAARFAERAINEDRYNDELWQLRIEALERAGQVAEVERVRVSYRAVLSELGLAIAI